jgi:hypothetical protein
VQARLPFALPRLPKQGAIFLTLIQFQHGATDCGELKRGGAPPPVAKLAMLKCRSQFFPAASSRTLSP